MPLERAQASGAINQELLIKFNLALTLYWEITKAVKVLICHTKKRVLAEMPVYLSWEGLALPVDDNAAGSCQRFRSPVRATLNTAIVEEKNFKWKKKLMRVLWNATTFRRPSFCCLMPVKLTIGYIIFVVFKVPLQKKLFKSNCGKLKKYKYKLSCHLHHVSKIWRI